jgi:hypothetical protein
MVLNLKNQTGLDRLIPFNFDQTITKIIYHLMQFDQLYPILGLWFLNVGCRINPPFKPL